MTNVVESVFGVFTEVGNWISGAIEQVAEIFYTTEGGITFIGTLALLGLGMGIIYGLLSLVRGYLTMK